MPLFRDAIAVLDFGGQYAHLIANRIRRLGVYSEIVASDTRADQLGKFKGVILSGSPHSVLDAGSPTIDPALLDCGIPLLGLCYGHQLVALKLGGRVVKGTVREYGRATLSIVNNTGLLKGLDATEQVWMSHGDTVDALPAGFMRLGSTQDCALAAVGDPVRNIYGLQFHPEVTDTPHGMKVLDNYIDICKCDRSWNSKTFIDAIEEEIRRKCSDRKVFLLVSGGVDSSVAFALLIKVLGAERVMGLHIDNGLMRHRESGDIHRVPEPARFQQFENRRCVSRVS
jgi:GMP synthase (glutamine-hydrolysing)